MTSHSKLIHNEKIIRKQNMYGKQAIKKFFRNKSVVRKTPLDFACECSVLECDKLVKMSIKTYEELHIRPDWFAVYRGHATKKVEKVIEQRDNFDVVEKLTT